MGKIFNGGLVLVWTSVLVLTGCSIAKTNDTSKNAKLEDISQYKQANEYVYCDKDVSDSVIDEVNGLMNQVPNKLAETFKEHNGKVVVTSNLEDKNIGKTIIDEKTRDVTIYIQPNDIDYSLLHEFGHVYLDYNDIDEDEFNSIFKEEAKSLVTAYYGDEGNVDYYYNDETEYFAEAFQTVLAMGGHDTLNSAPKTFEYMTSIITDLVK